MKSYDPISGLNVGDEIRITHMEGEPQYTNKEGVVTHVDDMGQVHGTWGIALQPERDSYVIIKRGGYNA